MRIEKEEQYSLISLENIVEEEFSELVNAVEEDIEGGNRNFIIDLSEILVADKELVNFLGELSEIVVASQKGILIVTGARGEMSSLLADKGLISISTIDEASDYIFMEEMEKQLLDEDDTDDIDE